MSRDHFMNRDKEKGHPSYRRSKKQESALAKRGNGLLVPGSGSGPEKGDVKKYNGIFRLEAKTTKNKSFSVTRKMVQQIEDAALGSGELPAIIIEFNDGNGNPEMEVAVVPTYILDSIKV